MRPPRPPAWWKLPHKPSALIHFEAIFREVNPKRTVSTVIERRAIETMHASYWQFLRHLFKIVSTLNRPKAAACATSSDTWERLRQHTADNRDRKSTRLNSSH